MDNQTNYDTLSTAHLGKDNVIAMKVDATYFYERGVRFLQRNDLQRALKAFRKTIEFEPENPINYCNLAGVLSEMGDFQASNELLLKVLEDIAPGMAECQFYLANNYANMGQYDQAEEYVLKYLDADPEGEYAEDAEEMLDVLLDEFGGGKAYAKWEEARQAEEQEAAKRDGRHLLENGQFEAAVEWLEDIVGKESDNTAAHNNLSLAYYYTGQHEKAIRLTEHVLDYQPDNIHALCNMTVFLKYLGPKEHMLAYAAKITKIFPLHYELAMKVGTTLGLVGHHVEAERVFERLSRMAEVVEPVLIHSIAASAANAGHLHIARKWWKQLIGRGDVEAIGLYYLDLLDKAEQQGKKQLRVSYQYDLPIQVQFTEMKRRLSDTTPEVWRKDPLLRASLYWGLRNGGYQTRRAVIRTLALMGDEDARRALRLFLRREEIEPTLQAAALVALQCAGEADAVLVLVDGQEQSINPQSIPLDTLLSIDVHWQEIWDRCERWLTDENHAELIKSAKSVWGSYVKELFLATSTRLGKLEIWVAGLVYITLRYHGVSVSQKDIAESLHVAPASVRKATMKLEAALFRSQD